MKNIISPSILSGDFAALGNTVTRLCENGADWAHVDIMDGVFVDNITIGIPVVAAIRKYSAIPLDVHLMIKNPLRYVGEFAAAGADMITFHIEAESDPGETIDAIHACGKKAGLSVKPGTPAEAVFPYLDKLDMVLVMSVEPGFGGQKFNPTAPGKISIIRQETEKRGLDTIIQVDGGINRETLKLCHDAGAGCFAVGSTVFKAPDMKACIEELRNIT